MAGETKRTYAAKELDAGSKKLEEGSTREQYSEKRQRGSPERYSNGAVESRLPGNGAKFIDKDRESTQQREAVIRPQQAGKIDFKSLQNRPKFTSDSRPWPSGKGSPQSPSGKSRSRDKGKKSSKSDRGAPQQLYRLSISNPRSNNPTIGIAYPQQKVSPPKKLEAGRGPVSGSYRFHVPSIPEREAELQQEDRNYGRCFQEGPSNLTSPSYTSQVVVGSSGGPPAPQHPSSTQQQQQQQTQQQQQQQQQQQPLPPQPPGPLDTSGPQPSSQMLFSDFQLNGTDAWQSPERTLTGANYGITAQKNNVVVEPNKAGFMPMSFQYGFPLLEDSATDAFSCDQNPPSQDYMDASLAPPGQVPHNPFAFQPSAEGQEAGQGGGGQFGAEQSDDRPQYALPPQPQPYLPIPHGPPSSLHCPRGMGDEPGLGESSVPSAEQSKGGVTDKMDGAAISGGKRNCHLKDSGATAAVNQRVLIQSNVHHIRNIAQGPGSQMHFPGKAYGNPPLSAVHMGPMPHDKNVSKSHSRAPQPWEGQNKACPPMEQSSLAYSNLPEKYPFQCQPAHDQRQGPGKNNRMPWQQMRLSSAMPNQNRIELSRQLSNQKLTFVISPSEWQEEEKLHKGGPLKSPGTYQNKRPTEGYSNQRQESVKQTCSTGMPPCPYKNKTEAAGHVQVCDAKNKSLYFGMNQTIPGAPTRACSYPPPMQVPPMGMMLVSPYESPLPSPTQNPASSSTCSSLSPASTSPINSSSDDGQISKPVGPPPFYHQPQGKALTSTDHLNSNHNHFHTDTSRGLPYPPPTDRHVKEDMMGFLQNNRTHAKSGMETSKGCMDNFGMEHHPPPPYSAHQLLATSLATANLDQLDVLLTCKQCDQNFNNLVSFLEHKQYCGQHAFAQNDFKDISKEDPKKALAPGTGFSQLSRCPSDLHLSLLGLSKNGEIIPDTDAKVDPKDDPLKLNLFSGGNNPPASLPDLEMEDAKLDSLITEALNGLGYQSDNAEIDSSFIDAFVDDDLTTAKCTSNRQTLKTKDCVMFESRTKHEASASERSYTQGKCSYDSDVDSRSTDSKQTESSNTESQSLEQSDDTNSKEESSPESISVSALDKEHKQWMKETRKSETTLEESSSNPRFVLSKKFSERCGIKSVQESSLFVKSSVPKSPSGNRTSTTQRLVAREGKRKRTGGGTWSKELIHKIVQQKNKLHKLHVKGTKNMQFSLVMERLTPTVQTPTFREYDYVSDSDEDCEPLKIAGKGRLSQSIRCKYTYTKECKGRARSEKSRELPWKQDKNDCFDSKKVDDMSSSPVKERLRRRSSRSSTSSELSTSVSITSDSISSPKSTDRTDSDSERKVDVKRKDSDSFEQNGLERSPHRVRREANTSVALSFSKNTKRYSTEKILLSANKEDSTTTTTTKCSSSSSRNTEIVSELTKTRSVFRFKSTEVSASVAKEDLFSCETGIMARTEESTCHTKESHKTSSSSKHYSAEVLSNKELNSYSKHKKDDSSSKVKPPSHKRKDENISDVTLQHSDTPAVEFDRLAHGVHSASKEPANFHTDLVKKPPSLCNVLMDEVCLSPTHLQDAVNAQKDTMRHSLMPCPLEQDQSLLKSPLSFDTSSMFGDLTVGGFDNNLYPDIQLNKDSFSPLEPTSDKKEMFESSFSPFLEQRDWGLMVDVTPELPDEISQYKDDSDAESEKKTSFGAVPFTLPDKIMNYGTGLSNCVSEDELEIKRIVTELESQLQTNKLSTSPLLEEELPKQLTMSKFSPLRLDQETDNEPSGLEVDCTGESLALTAPSLPTDPHSEGFSEPEMPWASPLQFGLVETQHCLHTPTHSITHTHDTLSDKVGTSSDLLVTEKEDHPGTPHKSECDSNVKSPHTDKSEEMLENEMYKENLMKSLEVISDSIFKKDVLPLPLQESKLLQSSPERFQSSCQETNHSLMGDKTTSEPEEKRSEKQSEAQSVSAGCEMAEEVDAIKPNDSSEYPVTQNNTNATESSQMGPFHHLAAQLHDPQNPEEICEHLHSKALTRHQDSSESPELLFPTTVQYEQEQSKESCNWASGQLEQEEVELNSKQNADQTGTEDASKESEVSQSCHGEPSVSEVEEKSKESVEEGCLTAHELKESESVAEDEEAVTNTAVQPACGLSQEEDKSDKTENITDEHPGTQMTDGTAESTCHASPLISITEHFSGAHTSHAKDPIMDTDIETSEVITSDLSDKIPEGPGYQDILVQPTLTMVMSPLTPACTDDLNEEDSSKHLAMPPLSPCLPDSSTQAHASPALHMEGTELNKTKWSDDSQPTKDTEVPSEEQNELNCMKDTFISEPLTETAVAAVGLDLPCIPQLEFEMPKSEMSISDTMVCDSIVSVNSNLTVPSTTETFPSKDSVYDFKLSPLSYKEVSDNQEDFDYNFSSLPSEKEIVEYTCVKSSPKSDGDHSNTDLLLPSNELSTADDDQELKLSTDPNKLETLNMQSIPLQNSHIEDNSKCSFSDVTCSRQQECVTTNKLHVSKMENCHVALETIDFMDFHLGLLKKTDGETFDTLTIPSEDVSFNLRESNAVSSNQKVLPSQGDTATESSSTSTIPSNQTEEGFVAKHTEAKPSPKKNSASHTGQGNFQCEICSMYFRTLPGLKRHKAMKHVVRTNVSQSISNNTSVYQTTVPAQQDAQPLNLLNMHSLQTQDNGISLNVEEPASMLESTANEPDVSAEPNHKDKKRPPATEKARKNGKAWKNKNSEVGGGSYPFNIVKVDPFPDELLSMLDTELLQSIPPELPPVSDMVEKLTMESDDSEHKYTTLPIETCSIEKQDLLASESDSLHSGLKSSVPPEEPSDRNELTVRESKIDGLSEKNEACNMKTTYAQTASTGQENLNAELQQKAETEIKSENINEPMENPDLLPCSFKDPPASPPVLGPDLALLDDESTFSQLFPRTEEMKRKKCPRVYGNKKQKVAPNVSAVQDYPPTDVYLDSREDYKENKTDKMFVNNVGACEYNMTVDDAIMLDMCHKGAMKGSAEKDRHSDSMTKEKSYEGAADHGMNTYLCPTEDISKVAVQPVSSNAVANTDPLVSPDVESCKSEHTDTFHSAPPCVQENVSHFPSIDIQNLNTTFQLPEIQFFDPGKDIPIVGNIISEEDVLQNLPTESEKPAKKPTERKGRKRGEAGLKPKDKQYKCKVCFTWFLTLGELNFHKLSHNPSPPPTCYMCVQRKFSSREQLRDHLREKHAKNKAGMWSCGMCLKEISDVWMYNEHLREHATQFARKGQTQSSLLDMPGCFMQENAVKNFITSIMQHQPSKSSRGDSAKSSSREDRRATPDTTGQDTKTDDDSDPIVTKTKSSGGSKHSSFTPLEVLKAEIAPKNVEMHPNCKDPSRDCHHCGKQFPKPFKLQRHLVVHSLQKIFLCHKCPVSYQEAKDLKDHLKNEHEEVDESDSKHTTLYTCELCADVMHVIKKSFICSTCNYIFSKKEQYDRHMEKHLAGGNKIFKFKGVLRPCKPTVSKDDSFNSPPSKKRKILPENLQENSSDSGIASVASCHLGQSVELEVLKPAMVEPMQCSDDDEHQREMSDTDVKMEDEIVDELKECQFNVDSAVQTSPPKAIPKTEECDDLSHIELAQETNNNGKGEKCMTANCDVKEEDDPLATPKPSLSPETLAKNTSVTEDERDCTSEPKQCFSENIQESLKEADHNKSEVRGGESSNISSCSPQSENLDTSQAHDLSHKEPLSYSTKLINEQMREEKAKDHPALPMSCDNEGRDPPSASGTEQFVTPQVKERVSSRAGENHKHSPGASPRALSSGLTEVSPVSHSKVTPLTSSSNEDKESTRLQKKRKETKVAHNSQKTSSTVARENLGIDSRAKKKFRPGKAELPSGLRKPEAPGDYPVLSSVKDDIVSNKIVSKHRTGTLGLQLKRGSLDNYPPKKTEIVRHLNVDFKGKRLGPGRPAQSPTSKVSVSSLSNSLNKSKPKAGVRSVDTHSYRTAESQNNLLSQLFGQKLTSFKIPLRKDTSESIN